MTDSSAQVLYQTLPDPQDPQAQVVNLMMELQADLGLSFLFISHDMAVVASICDEVMVMQQGRTVEYGPAGTVLTAPDHPYTQSLLTAAGA